MVGWASRKEVKECVNKSLEDRLKYKLEDSYTKPTTTLLGRCTIIVGKERKTCSTEEEAIQTLYHGCK